MTTNAAARLETTHTTADSYSVCRQCKARIEAGVEYVHVAKMVGDRKVDGANLCITCATAAGMA